MDRKDKNPAAVKSNTEPLLDSTVSSCLLQTFHLIFSLTEPHNFIVTNRAKTTNCHIWIFANSQEHVRSAGTIVQQRWRRRKHGAMCDFDNCKNTSHEPVQFSHSSGSSFISQGFFFERRREEKNKASYCRVVISESVTCPMRSPRLRPVKLTAASSMG